MSTGRDIFNRLVSDIESLAGSYKNKLKMFQELANQSNVSFGIVAKIYYAQRPNPTINTLDKLVVGVRVLAKRRL